MKKHLIENCICGNAYHFEELKQNGIPLLKCKICRVKHQKVEMSESEYNHFYNTDYHSAHQISIGCAPYSERYMHDFEIGLLRLRTYSQLLGGLEGEKVLDVGSGNGAFVDACRESGIEAYGIDLGHLGNPAYTFSGQSILDKKDDAETYGLITMHDVLEHLVDPKKHLRKAYTLLKPGGHLIVDFPHYYVDAGKHHWRPIQHLWYFNSEELVDLLELHNFTLEGIHTPIPSKLVFYCRK